MQNLASRDHGNTPHIAIYIENTTQDQPQAKENNPRPERDKVDRTNSFLIAFAAIQSCIFLLQAIIGYIQIRPYVFIEDATIIKEDGKWAISYKVRNSGVTPAHNVRTIDTAAILDWEPTGPLPTPDQRDSLGSIGPHGDGVDMDAHDVPYDPSADLDIFGETRAIFLRGSISYRDNFRLSHRTNFCFYATGEIAKDGDGSRMSSWDKGNDST